MLYQNRSDTTQEKYIVQVRRIGGVWEYTVEIGGVETKLPGKVFDRLTSYRQSIIKEQRRDRAQNRLRRIAADDQAAATREPDDPAGALAFLGGADPDFVESDDDLDNR